MPSRSYASSRDEISGSLETSETASGAVNGTCLVVVFARLPIVATNSADTPDDTVAFHRAPRGSNRQTA